MKILVTGASGFFGSRLVPALVALGHEVVTFGRSKNIPAFADLPVAHVIGDLASIDSLTGAMSGVDIVFHMAGLVSYRRADYDKLYQANVIGTGNVMEAALSSAVKRVIHLSSIAGMGIPAPGTLGDELIEYNLRGLGLYYCDTKHDGEVIALRYAQQGLPVIVLSPGITFGEGDTHPHHHTIFTSMARGGLMGYPKGGVTFSDIQDVVQVCINAMTMGRVGERYVIGSANMTFKNAAIALSEVIGCKPPVFAIPGVLSEVAGLLCETIFPLCGQTPRLTRGVAWLSQRNIFFSSDKAVRELNLPQTPFAETIRRTAPYYLSSADKIRSLDHSPETACF
jgi:dihydroflavonol-4-reductase